MESPPTRCQTRVPCIGRRIPIHCATREVLLLHFLLFLSRIYIQMSDPMDYSSNFLIFSVICSVSLLLALNLGRYLEIYISELLTELFILLLHPQFLRALFFLLWIFLFYVICSCFQKTVYYPSEDINNTLLIVLSLGSGSVLQRALVCLCICMYFFLAFSCV